MNIDFGMLTREESHQGFISEFLKELEKGLRNMNNEIKEYTIDRFEGDFAVCEDSCILVCGNTSFSIWNITGIFV